jgi:hypothetical protein
VGTKKVTLKEARSLRGTTNWKELKSLTDEEIKTAARLDLDAQELGPIELKRFMRERKE